MTDGNLCPLQLARGIRPRSITRPEGSEEGLGLPSGRLRAGLVRVAGVATEDAFRELLRFMLDRGYPTPSRALGAALQEWAEARRKGVLHPADPLHRAEGASPDLGGVVHPPASRREGL